MAPQPPCLSCRVMDVYLNIDIEIQKIQKISCSPTSHVTLTPPHSKRPHPAPRSLFGLLSNGSGILYSIYEH